ncbi:MAG: hypothetical protein ACLGI3_16425, partial [Actinomycetes bacterium]
MAVVLLGLCAWGVVDLLRIGLDVRAARASVLGLQPGSFDGPRGVGYVTTQADARLRHADDIARTSPPLRLAAAVPLVGDQVGTLRDATGRAREMGGIVARMGADLQRQVDAGTGGSANRLALVEVLARSTDEAAKAVRALDPLPRRTFALPALRIAREIVVEEQEEATVRLNDASVQADALRGL